MVLHIGLGHSVPRLHPQQDAVVVEVGLLVHRLQHLPPAPDQEQAEPDHDPLEVLDQRRAEQDQRAAHHERADDAPEQHPVLHRRGHLEMAEDQDENEDVVDRERPLDQIAGEEFEAFLAAFLGRLAVEGEQTGAEDHREREERA